MLQAALGAFILLGVYKLMNSKSEYEINGMMAFVFIFTPGLMIFLISLGLAYYELSENFILYGYLLYFIIPFLVLKQGLEFKARQAFNFSIAVPIVAILTEIPFVVLLASQNA
jgi:hypothetical protein